MKSHKLAGNSVQAAAELLGRSDRHLEGLLSMLAALVAEDDLRGALRYADRIARIAPSDPVLAAVVARLMLRAGEHQHALGVLAKAESAGPHPDCVGIRSRILLVMGDRSGTVRVLTEGLAAFALDAIPELAQAAIAIVESSASDHQGWVGFMSEGAIAGSVLTDSAESIRLYRSGSSTAALNIEPSLEPTTDGLTRFRFAMPPGGWPSGLQIFPNLIGGKVMRWPPPFNVSSTVCLVGNRLEGSLAMGWAPSAQAKLRVRGAGRTLLVTTDGYVGSAAERRQSFSCTLDESWLRALPLSVSVVLPGGLCQPLDGSPIGGADPVPPYRDLAPPVPASGVTVIVPAVGGLPDLDCFGGLLETIPPGHAEIVVATIGDANATAIDDLRSLAQTNRLVVHYGSADSTTDAINEVIASRSGRDIVILDGATGLPREWLTRLHAAAYSQPGIASAATFSNSSPYAGYALASALAPMLLQEPCELIEVPSASGPCVYLRRDALEEVGPLDSALGAPAAALIDFGLRARRRGWWHVAAADLFVADGPWRDELDEVGQVLGRLHPGYAALRQQLSAMPTIAFARRRFDQARLAGNVAQSVLLITLARSGGVRRHVGERAELWQSRGYRVLELKPAETPADGLCRVVIHDGDFQHLVYQLPEEFEGLVKLLQIASITSIEFHHTLGLDPLVLQLPERLGAPFDIYVHDYSWICPRITLIGAEGAYCGEPPVETCEACVEAHGSELEESIPVELLRQRSHRLFMGARSLVMPTRDVAARLRRHFPGISPNVRPWEAELPAPPPRVPQSWPLRVAVIGSIGIHKGYDILLACARDAVERDLPIEFVVFGHTSDDAPLFATGRVFVTGPYEDAELPELLARESCDAALFASVWPETWNYALSHALRAALPVVAFDLGGLAERLRGRERVILLPLCRDSAPVNDALLSFGLVQHNGPLRPEIGLRFVEPPGTGAEGSRAISQIAIWLDSEENANLIEYKVLSADGEISEWCPQGEWCGGGEPIVAFAVRGAPLAGALLRCRYDGWFRSGVVIRNIGNGNPCRSPEPDDPLVAMHLSIIRSNEASLEPVNDLSCKIPELSFNSFSYAVRKK